MMEDLLLLQVVLKEMCDKKNSVLFTKTECLILSLNFNCLMKIKYCLRRMGHINFKTMNKLVKGNLVKGLPSKIFENATFVLLVKRESITKPLNMVLVTKPYNKTSYELLIGRAPIISFMRPFGCPVTILNTLDHPGKFDGKADEGFLVGYSLNSKAFRVYNSRTKKVEEKLHVNFLKNKPNVAGSGPEWLFDIDSLTNSMNYQPISTGNRTNGIAGSYIHSVLGQDEKEKVSDQEYIILPVLNTSSDVPSSNEEVDSSPKDDAGKKSIVKPTYVEGGKIDDLGCLDQQMKSTDDSENTNSSISINNANPNVNTASDKDGTFQRTYDTRICDDAYVDRDEGAEADYNNLEIVIPTLVDLPHGKRAIRTKWVYRKKRDQRGIVVRNKAKLVAQGHRQEEGIDYDEVFAPIARIEAIRLFLAYASIMNFTVYQMNVKSTFIYGTIEEDVYVSQPPCFVDLQFPDKLYKVEKALYGLHQAPRAWYETLSNFLFENRFKQGTIDKTLFIKKIKNDILLVQVYVDDIIFGSTKRSLMYLTSSKPDIMFAACACLRFQVQPKVSHMHAVKRIFRYLKGHPTLGLWYLKDLPLEFITYSDSDYASASLDRKSITRGCQFLGGRLISWQCKKQTIVANSTTKAEYIAASSCYRQVLWLQNQLLDYGYNFMQTKIHVDNKSAICVVKNPVYHSKTTHIEIRHHFIRDSYEKRLIEMVKIHTDSNVADLLMKAFDVTRFQFLVASIADYIFWILGMECKSGQVKQIGIELKGYFLNDGYAGLVQHARKMTTGKEFSNPLMAGSLPKTISAKPNEPPLTEGHTSRNGEGRLEENIELMDTVPTPYDSPLTGDYTPGSDEAIYNKAFITLTNRVKKLESQLKQKRSKAVIHSLNKEGPSVHIEDSPKQGRIIEEMDKDENIKLVIKQGEVYETAQHSRGDDDETLA
uniref:Uncharacterized protein n=1 Tax=Tanacetum cinerariifolium TaxID=118510 RepID=A0A6L2MZK3_TANCI|nr:hypothetical protein [Tanacetum cinerariifolium]